MTRFGIPIRFPTPRRSGSAALAAATWAGLFLAAACGDGTGGAEARSASPGQAPGADTVPRRQALPPRGEAWVVFGDDTVRAEVAETPEARERGLMHRQRLDEGQGMLFVFESERIRSFWMKNTYIPLDIAFLDSALEVVDIQQMEPETEELYESERPTMFALEVPRGWFEAHGVEEGDRAEIVFGPR